MYVNPNATYFDNSQTSTSSEETELSDEASSVALNSINRDNMPKLFENKKLQSKKITDKTTDVSLNLSQNIFGASPENSGPSPSTKVSPLSNRKPTPRPLQNNIVRSNSLPGSLSTTSLEKPVLSSQTSKTKKKPRPSRTHSIGQLSSLKEAKKKVLHPKRKRNWSASHLPMRIKRDPLGFPEWEQRTQKKLKSFAIQKIKDGERNPLKIVREFIDTCGVRTTTIHRRIQEVLKVPGYEYLSCFLDIHNPSDFIAQKSNLKNRQQRVLLEAIGGKAVLLCLKNLTKSKTQKKLSEFVLYIFLSQMSKRKIRSSIDFDQDSSMSHMKKEGIVNSFLFYYIPGIEKYKSTFVLNRKVLLFPNFGQTTGQERKIAFMEWLIENLNAALDIETNCSSKLQAKFICEGALDLTVLFESFLVQYQTTLEAIPTVLQRLEKHNYPVTFQNWAAENLSLFYGADKEVDLSAVVNQFVQDSWFELCSNHVPCFRILQALSSCTYSCLLSMFSKQIFQNELHIEPLQTDPTCYTICINSATKSFTVTHQAPHRLIFDRDVGFVRMYVSIKGHDQSSEFSTGVWSKGFVLDDALSFKERLQISQQLYS